MLKIVSFFCLTIYLLFGLQVVCAEQSRILSQDVQVNYALPKRVGSTPKIVKQNTIKHTSNQRSYVNPEAQTPITPTSSLRKIPTNENKQDAKTIDMTQEHQKQKNTVLTYEDVYALSPYAKYLRRGFIGHMPPVYTLAGTIPWQYAIERASLRYTLSPELIAAVIKAESNFNAHVVSSKGAEGLMQIMPATQDYLNLQDPFNPELNIMAGSAYLREQLDRFGSLELALAAYNAGPGNVVKYNGIPPFYETQNYITKVLQYKKNYSQDN